MGRVGKLLFLHLVEQRVTPPGRGPQCPVFAFERIERTRPPPPRLVHACRRAAAHYLRGRIEAAGLRMRFTARHPQGLRFVVRKCGFGLQLCLTYDWFVVTPLFFFGHSNVKNTVFLFFRNHGP